MDLTGTFLEVQTDPGKSIRITDGKPLDVRW